LLASIQYRQGPISVLLNGFGQVLADGLKVYSKHSSDSSQTPISHVLLSVIFGLVIGVSSLITGTGFLSVCSRDSDWLLWLLFGCLAGFLVLSPLSLSGSRFVSLGVLRQVRAVLVGDLVVETAVLILLVLLSGLSSSGLTTSSRSHGLVLLILLAIPLGISSLIVSGRAPYDLPEAESELVAGSITELGGISFSLWLLLDWSELVLWSSALTILVVSLTFNAVVVVELAALSYLGRCMLVRISLAELLRTVFIVLLWILGLMLEFWVIPPHLPGPTSFFA
jgi:NADH-quinone oxidoreductase subunit H